MSRAVVVLRAVAATALLTVTLLGVPVLLAVTVGNPWPGRDQIALRDELDVVTGTLAALTWIVWARLVVLVVVELVRQVRWVRETRTANRSGVMRRPVHVEPLPMASGALALAVQRLIATILLLVPLTTRSPRPAEAAPPLPVMAPADPMDVIGDGVDRYVGAHPAPASALPSDRQSEVTVGPNETLRGLAAAHLGDAGRWREIFELNTHRIQIDGHRLTTPSALRVGWQLELPDDARARRPEELADDRHDAIVAVVQLPMTERHVPESAAVPATTHVVVQGDTLWDLAESRLAAHDGDGSDTARYVDEIVAANPAIVDPDLIFPSQHVLLPQIGTDRVVSPEPFEPSPDGRRGSAPDGGPLERRDVEAGAANGERRGDGGQRPGRRRDAQQGRGERPGPPHVTTPTVNSAPPGSTGSSELVPGAASADDIADPGDAGESAGPRAPVGVGIAAASVGVLAVLGSLRRRRLRAAGVRSRLERPPNELVATERMLRRVEGAERSALVDVAVRAAASSMLDTDRRLVALVVDVDGRLCAVTDGPVHLPPPWLAPATPADRWTLPASASLTDLAPTARQVAAPCPALVAVGATPSGADVLVDLEGRGALSVEAGVPAADQVVASIAAGLAGSVLAEGVQLIAVGVPMEAFLGHANHHEVGSVDEALELASELGAVAALRGLPSTSTFHLRARHTGGESWEPTVVFVGSSHLAELDLLVERPGLAYVVAGSRPDGHWLRLVPGGDCWRLEPIGIELTPAGLEPVDLERIDRLLAHERSGVDDARDVDGEVDTPWEPPPEPDWRLLVRVLGLVDVVDRSGTQACFGKSKSLELLAWVASHRDRATRQGARSALWDVDVRDATFANIVSEARRAAARLCRPEPGEEWLARTMNASLRLHEHVVTDAALVAARLARARREPVEQAIETLRSAVELIRGVPFAESGYLWPDAEGITSELVVLATSCCGELAELLLERDDVQGVFWATGQGLKVLPGHEELIALRMRAHGRRGDRAGVRSEWATYERVLVADAWSDGEPAPSLVTLRDQLLQGAAASAG